MGIPCPVDLVIACYDSTFQHFCYGKLKTEIEITPSLALSVLRSLPELIPEWIKERGGVYQLYSKLGYITPQSADAVMQRRKKKGWSLRSLIQWVEVIESSQKLNKKD